jgi:hypothetical protein
MVVQSLSADFHFNFVGRAQALQSAAGKTINGWLDAVIQGRMQFYIAHFVSPKLSGGDTKSSPGGLRPGQPVSI